MTPKSKEEQLKGFDRIGPMSVLNYGNKELIPWVIEYALNRGADPNLRFRINNIEMTPLEHAALEGNMEVIEVLLKHDNVRITMNAIGNAIYKGHKDIVDILEKNAKPGLSYESIRDKMTPKSNKEIQHNLLTKYNIKPEIFEFLTDNGYTFVRDHETAHRDRWRITIEFRNEEEKNSVYFLPGESLDDIKKRIK